jgi:hypothetical protein
MNQAAPQWHLRAAGVGDQLENDYSAHLTAQLDLANGRVDASSRSHSGSESQRPWDNCLELQTKLDAHLVELGQ